MSREIKNQFLIFLSLFIALYIDSYLFPGHVQIIKPTFVLLTLIYWNMALPDKVGISVALLFGIFVDLIEGSLLGLHGILFVLITYVCQRFFYQFRVSPLWQQSFTLFCLFILYKQVFALDIINSNQDLTNFSDRNSLINSLLFALFSALIWPPLLLTLRYYRRRWVKTN
ncbi:MAG: rod shape-determining protein MreD [Candidatus Marinimicrobia bacterium]|nr:rod shape-determining protein MreD [Candidatus Neomarinimicrobiota bacterium]|tara:strand:+ start:2748 stop:3257 length:510 start_codon:yes stop_codon:yes gene_type:complete